MNKALVAFAVIMLIFLFVHPLLFVASVVLVPIAWLFAVLFSKML